LYGSKGFIPLDTINEITDQNKYEQYKENSKIVKTTLVKNTNIKKYFIEAVIKLKMEKKYTKQDIANIFEKYKNDSIMNFFRVMTKNRQSGCAIFSLIYEKIMKDTGMNRLFGTSYYKAI